VVTDEVGHEERAWLAHVDEFITAGQWQDAVETLRRVMETRGERLIALSAGKAASGSEGELLVPLRVYCQMQIASWQRRAPEALKLYRQQVDERAARLVSEAGAERDAAGLQLVVDELLLSATGDEALLRLGEMALEAGNYTLARHCWESIHPSLRVLPAVARVVRCAPGSSWWLALRGRDLASLWPDLAAALSGPDESVPWLAYPDSDIPRAAVRARLVLVSLLEGSYDRAVLEAELLRRLDGDVTGHWGGRRGAYVQLVDDLLRAAQQWPAPPRPAGWSTFAGCPSRQGAVETGVDVAMRPVWRTPLPRQTDPQDRRGRGRPRAAEAADGLLSHHVAVDDGVVYVAQLDRIRALRLDDGQPAWPGEMRSGSTERGADAIFHLEGHRADPIAGLIARTGVPRWTVTLDGGRLFARLGAAWTGGGDQLTRRDDERSCLIGLELATQKLLFDPIPPGEAGWEFESSPLVRGGRLYASLRRRNPASAQVRVVCYAVETGRAIWQRDVARGETVTQAVVELPNCPLTWGDELLYCNTNLGAVAALRARDGRLEWVYRYGRTASWAATDADRSSAVRDVNPCLFERGIVYVAPADTDHVLALDAASGRPLWHTAPEATAGAVHLLGVAGGRLLASGDCVQWIDVSTGQVTGQFPVPRSRLPGHAAPPPRGYGRGIVAGDELYWPTRDRVYVFDVGTGRQTRQPLDLAALGLEGGNLVISRHVLLIATADELIALAESVPQPEVAAQGAP
jgi:outer membrane protein assembly factor BamB